MTAPIGVSHTFENPGDVPAVFVGTLTPDLYVEYFRELRGLAWGPTGPDPVEVGRVMARYSTEVVRPG